MTAPTLLLGIRFVDLFAGVGGFRFALESLGAKCVAFSEIDKYALRTYKANYDTDGETELGDITKVDPARLPEFDLLVGGWPCQPFAICGHRKGFLDETRGTLFFNVARILRDRQPKYFILENVKGLINHDKQGNGVRSRLNSDYSGTAKGIGHTLMVIEQSLLECGYEVKWEVLNTKDFGLPQNRERIIFVGRRKDLGAFEYKFPAPTPLQTVLADLLEHQVQEKYYIPQDRVAEMLPRLGSPNSARQPRIVVDGKPDTDLHGIYGIMSRLDATIYKHPKYISPNYRRLTPKECFRLQGFPDAIVDRAVAAGVSDTQLYRQAGNAVSTAVIRAVAVNLAPHLV